MTEGLPSEDLPPDLRIGEPGHIASLARGLQIFEVLGRHATGISLADVAKQAGLDRAVCRRVLLTLCGLGYASVENRVYRPSATALAFGYDYLGQYGLDGALDPYLRALSQDIDEAVIMSVLVDDEVIFIGRWDENPHLLSYFATAGRRFPAVSTSTGRILLSQLSDASIDAAVARAQRTPYTSHTIVDRDALVASIHEARARGYAFNLQETGLGGIGAAVAVKDKSGRPIAALNASSTLSRKSEADFREYVIPRLISFAGERTVIEILSGLGPRSIGTMQPAPPGNTADAATASFARGLLLLSLFRSNDFRLDITTAARMSGIDRSAVRRTLKTLEAGGYVTASGRFYFPGSRMLRLAFNDLASQDLAELVGPSLQSFSKRHGVQSAIFVADAGGMRCVASADATHRPLGYAVVPGRIFAFDEGAASQMLRRDHDVPANGSDRPDTSDVIVCEEPELAGCLGIATPLRDLTGRVVAALCAFVESSEASEERTALVTSGIEREAATISRYLRNLA